MLDSLFNTNSVEVLGIILNEIHEYLIFSDKIDSFEKIFSIMSILICIYHQDSKIMLLCIQNIFNLISNDPKTAMKLAVKNGFSKLLLEFLDQYLKKPDVRKDVLESLAKMEDKETADRLFEKYDIRNKSFTPTRRLSLKPQKSVNTVFPTEFTKIMKYILRIIDYFLEFSEKIHEVLEILQFFPILFENYKNKDLSWMLLNPSEKYLGTTENLKEISMPYIKFLMKLTCQSLENPELKAKEEDQYLRKLEKVFTFGNIKTPNMWSYDERIKAVGSLIKAITVDNDGNSQEYLTNEFSLLEKILDGLEKTKEICDFLEKSEFLKTLWKIFFGEFLKKQSLVGVFITDRLFANGVSLVLMLYRKFDAKEWGDMKKFLEDLKKLEKEKGSSFGETRKKALQAFWKEINDRRSLEEIKAVRNVEAKEKKKTATINITKKYLVSRMDWMK